MINYETSPNRIKTNEPTYFQHKYLLLKNFPSSNFVDEKNVWEF